MTRRRTTSIPGSHLTAALALALASCVADPPTGPDSASLASVPVAAQKATFAAGGVAHVVTGHGTLWVPEPTNQYINISFDARVAPNGRASGNWHQQFRSRVPESRVFVKVTCMTVVGNEAWMAGYATQAGGEANIGRPFGLRVVDNGEGAGAVDQMTRMIWEGGLGGGASDYCENMPTTHKLWPLAAGNIQVR
jgi:hypothetical protein